MYFSYFLKIAGGLIAIGFKMRPQSIGLDGFHPPVQGHGLTGFRRGQIFHIMLEARYL
jgi:hypothetical protein